MYSYQIPKLFSLAWLLCMGIFEAQSRFPENLEQRSTLVCNGVVLSIEKIGNGPAEVPSAPPDTLLRAKIKILHVFKGQAPAEIEFRYHNHWRGWCYVDGLENVELIKDKRYRFFLVPDGSKNGYIGVLEAEHERFDIYDFEMIGSEEPDNSPYIPEKDAIAVAREFLSSKNIESQVTNWNDVTAECSSELENGARWLVFYKVKGQPAFTYTVAVQMDRKIDLELTRSP